jgi:Family of unknown function (DUF5989)
MDFLSELWLFMRVRKKFWLMPIFFMLVIVGGLMVLLTKGSVKTKEWNLLKEEFDALVRNGFPLQGSPPVGWPGLPRLHHRWHGAVILIASSGWIDSPDSLAGMEFEHRIQRLAESTERHNCFDNVREIPLDWLGASATFVTRHHVPGCLSRFSISHRKYSKAWPWKNKSIGPASVSSCTR